MDHSQLLEQHPNELVGPKEMVVLLSFSLSQNGPLVEIMRILSIQPESIDLYFLEVENAGLPSPNLQSSGRLARKDFPLLLPWQPPREGQVLF